MDSDFIDLPLKLDTRRGHNELDEPAFTQPLMYSKIRTRKSVPELYEDQLVVSLVLPTTTSWSEELTSLHPFHKDRRVHDR